MGGGFALKTTYHPTSWMLIAANGLHGRLDEARRFLEMFKSLAPGGTLSSIKAGQAAKDPSRMAAVLEGLRLAGLDES